jgi:hypothetical protein
MRIVAYQAIVFLIESNVSSFSSRVAPIFSVISLTLNFFVMELVQRTKNWLLLLLLPYLSCTNHQSIGIHHDFFLAPFWCTSLLFETLEIFTTHPTFSHGLYILVLRNHHLLPIHPSIDEIIY